MDLKIMIQEFQCNIEPDFVSIVEFVLKNRTEPPKNAEELATAASEYLELECSELTQSSLNFLKFAVNNGFGRFLRVKNPTIKSKFRSENWASFLDVLKEVYDEAHLINIKVIPPVSRHDNSFEAKHFTGSFTIHSITLGNRVHNSYNFASEPSGVTFRVKVGDSRFDIKQEDFSSSKSFGPGEYEFRIGGLAEADVQIRCDDINDCKEYLGPFF